ncbi:MAG: NADH-quinone oxidoreductase subunit B family protein [Desulfonatronovibrio sp.]
MNILSKYLNKIIQICRVKSPWMVHYDCGSCNGCDIETLACLTPVYDLERFGIINTGNPKHADILLVTGTVNHRNRFVLENIYNQMPRPRVVVSIGSCCNSGGIFRDCYNVIGGADKVIPVDIYVPGCPPKPEAIMQGALDGMNRLTNRQENL